MEGLKPPGELSFVGNVAENWRRWRRTFENYLLAINLVETPVVVGQPEPAGNAVVRRRQLAILLHTAGEEANEVYSQFEYDNDGDDENYTVVLGKFEDYCNPRRNVLYEWFVFWNMKQIDGEGIDTFVKRLKTQASVCDFGDLKDRMLLFRVVFGVLDTKLKERLLRENDLTLGRAMDNIRATEMTKMQLSAIADGDKTVAAVSDVPVEKSVAVVAKDKVIRNCRYCSRDHLRGKCPAYGKSCNKCKKLNHFAACCGQKKVDEVKDESTNSSRQLDTLFVGEIGCGGPPARCWEEKIKVGPDRVCVKFKLDTGAEVNVIPKTLAHQLDCTVTPSKAKLMGYGQNPIPNIGKTKLMLICGDSEKHFDFEVVACSSPPILGLQAVRELDLVRRVCAVDDLGNILDEFPMVFEGIGCLEGEHNISVDPTVKPVVHAARKVPLSIMAGVQSELMSMESDGIIAKVDVPTPWVNSMVIVEKANGALRICLDPKDLNRAILREHHKIPTIQDIALKFQGMNYFSILDMRHGYWHVPLTAESSLLTTFNTPFGRYRFLRLPFGLKSSAEVFEKRVEELFGDLPHVAMYFDDLVVAGKDRHEHDNNLRMLLERAAKVNVKFNRSKVQLAQPKVVYLGHVVSNEGLKPDPEKVRAISEMPAPNDKAGVQRLLGSLNYLGSYIPNLSNLVQPLRILLKNDSLFSWGPEQNEAFAKVKEVLASQPVLSYFDVAKPVTVQVDASQHGLGAVLLQEGHPVCYASRSLTSAESNYPQIEKELLAVVYGCEKFHTYIYGRTVNIQTDHKPLVPIISKPTADASPRLQRLLLRLEKYPDKDVHHVPGKELYLADTLSRAYLPISSQESQELLDDKVVMVHYMTSDESLKARLLHSYSKDHELRTLKTLVLTGWPNVKKSAPSSCKQYWSVKDTLHEVNGFLYVGDRLVVPKGERQAMLSILHQGHLGIEKCLDRAKRSVFWPGLRHDLEEYISSCDICIKHQRRQQREPLLPHAVPDLPWQKLALDILQFKGKDFLVVVDFFSHYPELRLLSRKTAFDVILALKSIFATHGVPLEVVADNMPFNSSEMRGFASEWGFNLTTASPNYPRSNGMAERYVQTVKSFLKKAEDSQGDVYASLLAYRETAISGCPYSPAEMLFGRQIRSKVPKLASSLVPKSCEAKDVLERRQALQKSYYDRGTKNLPPLTTGDNVVVRTDKQTSWEPAVVVDSHTSPRSYVIDDGRQLLRRNRVHLKPSTVGASQEPEEDGERVDCREELVRSDPEQSVAVTTPRKSQRSTRGKLPHRYADYDMSA